MTQTQTKRSLFLSIGVLAIGVSAAAPAWAKKPVTVTINHITEKGVGEKAGTITIKEKKDGLVLEANLKGIPAGEHGFHLHEKPSCDPGDKDGAMAAGIAAGPHYDPDATKVHKGPAGGGHKGDLPKLEVPKNGKLKTKVELAHLTLADVAGRSFMIHAGGDNYADSPAPLGGGGARIACGVIPGEPAAAAPAPKTESPGIKGDSKPAPAAPTK